MVRILDPPAEVDSRTLLCNDGSPSFGKVRASISVHKVVWLREPAVAFKERTTVGEEEHVQGTNISCNTTNGSVALYSVIAAASVRLYLGTRKGHTCITNQAYYPGQGASATVELTDFRASLADPRHLFWNGDSACQNNVLELNPHILAVFLLLEVDAERTVVRC